MKTIIIDSLNKVYNKEEIAIALGTFDGLHLGHQRLLNKLNESKLKRALLTFDKHPLQVLKNVKRNYLTSLKDKEELLKDKIDYLFVMNLSLDILNQTALDFINFLKNNNVKEVVCGYDYTFGRNKVGNAKMLKEYFNTSIIDEFKINDKRVSSSFIEELIKSGDIKTANKLLGRFYSVNGLVTKGLQNGRKIDFRTANISKIDYVIPKIGVYVTKTIIESKIYNSMTNVGNNPTIGSLNDIIIETNIFDFDGDIYDKTIKILFIDKIRDEKKFSSLDELKDELIKNRNYALDYFIKM